MGTHAQGDLPRTTRASPENASVPGSGAGGVRRLGGSGAGTRSSGGGGGGSPRGVWGAPPGQLTLGTIWLYLPLSVSASAWVLCAASLPRFPSSGLRVFRYRVVQAGEAELPTPLFERRLSRSVSVALATFRKEAPKLLVFSLKEQASSTQQLRDEVLGAEGLKSLLGRS